jgi:hypothetical protein
MTDKGRSAKDMLEEGVLNDLPRKFTDPYQILYDIAKGHWVYKLLPRRQIRPF